MEEIYIYKDGNEYKVTYWTDGEGAFMCFGGTWYKLI